MAGVPDTFLTKLRFDLTVSVEPFYGKMALTVMNRIYARDVVYAVFGHGNLSRLRCSRINMSVFDLIESDDVRLDVYFERSYPLKICIPPDTPSPPDKKKRQQRKKKAKQKITQKFNQHYFGQSQNSTLTVLDRPRIKWRRQSHLFSSSLFREFVLPFPTNWQQNGGRDFHLRSVSKKKTNT